MIGLCVCGQTRSRTGLATFSYSLHVVLRREAEFMKLNEISTVIVEKIFVTY